MSDIKLCRICLDNDVKLYKYNRYYLKQYYEDVMAVRMKIQDGLPDYFCYECACILQKFHKFKEKCHAGLKVLEELMQNGPITQKSISNIDRKANKLESSLNLIVIKNNVKTCIVKSKTYNTIKDNSDDGKKNLHEIEEKKLPKIEQVDTDYDSEDSLELAQYKNEIIQIGNEQTTNDNVKVKIDVEKCNDVSDINISDDDTSNTNIQDTAPDDPDVEKFNDVSDFNISDDDKTNTDIQNTAPVKTAMIKTTKINSNKSKKILNKENNKLKRFERKAKSNLDAEHWLKKILTEDEAVKEFRARESHPKYLAANYKCTECFKGFSKEDMLNRHKKLTHSESLGPIVCRFCSMRFKSKYYLTSHISQHYTKYKCLRCELVCPLETTAILHNDYHNGVTRKCQHCDQEFRHLSTYYTHLRTHRSEHVCTLCGASFVSETGLSIHKKVKHIDTVNEVGQGDDEYCERCDVRFETRKAFQEHLIHSVKHTDGLDDLEVLLSTSTNPRKRPHNSKTQRRKIPTDCHVCGKHFETQAACRKHHLAEHPRTSFFPPNERKICEVCGVSLAPGSVATHMNIHTREKIYPCKTCGREFHNYAVMKKHQLTHTSEKRVACTLCDKRFKEKNTMKLHYRTFHLKEPYPKRNRKKKDDMSKFDDYVHEESDEDLPLDRWLTNKKQLS